MVSIIYVTNRRGGIDILEDNLCRQTFQDFEIIVADDLYETRTMTRLPGHAVKHFKPREKGPEDAWNLNKAYNDAIDQAQGELLVFLQDYIWIPANGIERFWNAYLCYPKGFITGVGHKAKLPDRLEDITPGVRPTGVSEVDNRVYGEKMLVPTNWTFWELNWASAPRALMPRFEEELDQWYSGDNQVVAYKAHRAGYDFYMDRVNECVGYNQALFGRPSDWEERHANKGALGRIMATL